MKKGRLALALALAALAAQPLRAEHACIHDHIERTFRATSHARRAAAEAAPQAGPDASASDASAGSSPLHGGVYATSPQVYAHGGVDAHGRALQGSTYSPIRIKVDVSRLAPGADAGFACYAAGQSYKPTLATSSTATALCSSQDVLSDAQRTYLVATLLPQAVAFFTNALSVQPVVGNLTLPNPMSNFQCFWEGYAWNNFVCCDANFPRELRTTGVANADYLMIVTSRPTPGSILAWAIECQSDQYARPLCGHVNIAAAPLSTSPTNLAAQVGVVTHELSHALGFSSGKYRSFRQPGTLDQVSGLSDVMATYFDPDLGKMVSRIVTPNVKSWLLTHLNCPAASWPLAGGEIEDYGGSGTAGSHWEKRVVMNELMNGVSEPVMVRSGMTLAYFADTGWYAV
jgi:leishmanolysin